MQCKFALNINICVPFFFFTWLHFGRGWNCRLFAHFEVQLMFKLSEILGEKKQS